MSVEEKETETVANSLPSHSKKKSAQNTTPIRVKKNTARNIRTILKKLNKKVLGKKITTDSPRLIVAGKSETRETT